MNKAFIYKVDPPGHCASNSQIGYTVESPNILGPRGAKIASWNVWISEATLSVYEAEYFPCTAKCLWWLEFRDSFYYHSSGPNYRLYKFHCITTVLRFIALHELATLTWMPLLENIAHGVATQEAVMIYKHWNWTCVSNSTIVQNHSVVACWRLQPLVTISDNLMEAGFLWV